MVKSSEIDDMLWVLTGGTWKIMDHYVMVQRWRPNLKPSTAVFKTTPVLIRFPEFPIEYFDEDPLKHIGDVLGKPFKLDYNTSLASRGKFERMCIEVDLSKPLVSQIRVGNLLQMLEYESIHTVCFTCVVIGH